MYERSYARQFDIKDWLNQHLTKSGMSMLATGSPPSINLIEFVMYAS